MIYIGGLVLTNVLIVREFASDGAQAGDLEMKLLDGSQSVHDGDAGRWRETEG